MYPTKKCCHASVPILIFGYFKFSFSHCAKKKERNFSISSQTASQGLCFRGLRFRGLRFRCLRFLDLPLILRSVFSRFAVCGLRFRGLCFRDIRQTPLKLGTNNIRFHKYVLFNIFKQPPDTAETWSETSPMIICWLFVLDMHPEIVFAYRWLPLQLITSHS